MLHGDPGNHAADGRQCLPDIIWSPCWVLCSTCNEHPAGRATPPFNSTPCNATHCKCTQAVKSVFPLIIVLEDCTDKVFRPASVLNAGKSASWVRSQWYSLATSRSRIKCCSFGRSKGIDTVLTSNVNTDACLARRPMNTPSALVFVSGTWRLLMMCRQRNDDKHPFRQSCSILAAIAVTITIPCRCRRCCRLRNREWQPVHLSSCSCSVRSRPPHTSAATSGLHRARVARQVPQAMAHSEKVSSSLIADQMSRGSSTVCICNDKARVIDISTDTSKDNVPTGFSNSTTVVL